MKLVIYPVIVIVGFVVFVFVLNNLPESWVYDDFLFENGNYYTHLKIVDSFNDKVVIDNFDGFLKCDPALKIKITFDQKNFFGFKCFDRFPGRKNLKTQKLVYAFQVDQPEGYLMNEFVKLWQAGGHYMIGLYYNPPG